MASAPDPRADEALARARRLLQRARSVVVFTGAGVSAESGIPTFRDAMSGLWARFDPAELASEEGFRAAPERVWDWYVERAAGVRAAQPNAAHRAIASFESRRPGRVTVVTQNVDDLHQRAGSTGALRLHGDILRPRWLEPCRKRPLCDPHDAEPGRPPRCGECGNRVRPGVVWFGENLPEATLEAATAAAVACEAMLVIGTSGAVWPAAGLVGRARRAGAAVVIVNPHPSEIDGEADVIVAAPAAVAVPRLLLDDAG